MNDKIQTLVDTADTRVRIMPLSPGESTPWHHHTEVTDWMVCLEGEVTVEQREPYHIQILHSGEMCEVVVGRQHRVRNPATVPARYLLVQGVGQYDFIVTDVP